MNRDEIVKRLTDELQEELDGICEYNLTYESLKAMGLDYEARQIEKIASEEYYHAKILWDVLYMMNVDLSHHMKIQDGWTKVKKLFSIEE